MGQSELVYKMMVSSISESLAPVTELKSDSLQFCRTELAV